MSAGSLELCPRGSDARKGMNLTTHTRGKSVTVSTGSKWEPLMGYSRAVKRGQHIYVTGTVGINADGTFTPSLEAQTRRALEIILAALKALGADASNVVRTRIYTTDIAKWEEIAKVHGAMFADIRPATTLLGVAKLIDDAAWIEIEADAVLD
jgi:enamine deaminase RidA (YjgF/YER057c/UK114 family)